MSRLESDLLNYESKYEHNGVLDNKLGINNQDDLDRAERMITTRKLAKLYLQPTGDDLSPNHYLEIHKYLFEDIYSFAGEIRDEAITKSFSFCLPQYIYPQLEETIEKALKKVPQLNSRDAILVYLVKFYSELDFIHPFREGNGRTLREYIRQYLDYVCRVNNLDPLYLDYSNVNRDTYIKAIVKADALLEYDELLELFNSILKEKPEKLEENNYGRI